jgi:two-component system chemotaxis response regulator CheB
LGATDYIEKPSGRNLTEEADRIRSVLRSGVIKNKPIQTFLPKSQTLAKSSKKVVYHRDPLREDLILMGASTGGVEAIKVVLENFDMESPPIVIVQHIPPMFSRTFAERLNQSCAISVSEAKSGEFLEYGHAYIAPGGTQMSLQREGGRLQICISDGLPVNRHKPSVDYLFLSFVPIQRKAKAVAVLLTGMGADGAQGLLALKKAGCWTIAQDEESSVVFGMPKAAIECQAQEEIVSLESMAYHILKSFR